MKDSTFIFLAIPLFIGIELMGACDSCEDTTSSPPPEPTTTASSSTPPPSLPQPPPPPPKPSWAPVVDLDTLAGRWGAAPAEKGVWADMMERAAEGSLYPWYLSFSAGGDNAIYDCGVFEKVNNPEGWRVAYCKGGEIGAKRQAERLLLHTMPLEHGATALRIQLPGQGYELRARRGADE